MVVGDTKGKYILQGEEAKRVQEIHERLEHLTSDKQVSDISSKSDPSISMCIVTFTIIASYIPVNPSLQIKYLRNRTAFSFLDSIKQHAENDGSTEKSNFSLQVCNVFFAIIFLIRLAMIKQKNYHSTSSS